MWLTESALYLNVAKERLLVRRPAPGSKRVASPRPSRFVCRIVDFFSCLFFDRLFISCLFVYLSGCLFGCLFVSVCVSDSCFTLRAAQAETRLTVYRLSYILSCGAVEHLVTLLC